MAELINKTDSLDDGRVKLNSAITDAENAKNTANSAKTTANEAKAQSTSTQDQLDQIVIEGDSSVEAAQARVDTDGDTHTTLKERLDTEHSAVTSQLAEKAKQSDLDTTNLNLNETTLKVDDVRSKVPNNFGDLILSEHPLVENPVLTASDVTDLSNVRFVADPSKPYWYKGEYHIFFEVYVEDGVNDVGHIGHATSPDGRKWTYNKIVLSDGKHFALPTIIDIGDGEIYMLPDRGGRVEGVTLYRATNFPEEWVVDTVLIPTGIHIDPIAFEWNGKWYMHTYTSGVASLYIADGLKSNWTLHPMSPIATGTNVRGAGEAIISDDFVLLPMQDGTSGVYGEKVRMHKITNLTPTSFNSHIVEEPLIGATRDGTWSSKGMHTVNMSFANRNSNPIVAVDGLGPDNNWSIGIYTTGTIKQVPFFRGERATNIAIATGEWKKVNFDRIVIDNKLGYVGFPDSQYIIPETGYYALDTQLCFTADSSITTNVRFVVNGVEVGSRPSPVGFTGRQVRSLNEKFMLKKGDIVELNFYQNSGAGMDIESAGVASFLSIIKVG